MPLHCGASVCLPALFLPASGASQACTPCFVREATEYRTVGDPGGGVGWGEVGVEESTALPRCGIETESSSKSRIAVYPHNRGEGKKRSR